MRKKRYRRVPRDIVMPQVTQTPKPNQAEADIDRAVERVYRMYGPDLSVFFKAVQSELQLERHEKRDQGQLFHTDQ